MGLPVIVASRTAMCHNRDKRYRLIALMEKENLVKRISFTAGILLVVIGNSAHALEPTNPKANAKARAILNYLERLPQQANKRLLSGQFTDAGPTAKLAMCTEVHEKTGHWPAMIGLDYADFAKGGLEYKTVNRVAIEYARQGGLVTISAHLYNPANPKGGGLRDQGPDLKTILTPGNEVHDRWIKELDTLAAGLKELQDAGVVVLWRPFHEMNGGWFWWGGKQPETFIRGLAAYVRLLHQDQGPEQPAVGLLAQPRRQDGGLLCRRPLRRYRRAGRLYRFRRSPAHSRLRCRGEAAQAVRLHRVRALWPSQPTGQLRLHPLYRRRAEALSQDDFLPCLEWKWSLGRNQNSKQLLQNPWLVNREDLPDTITILRK